jgi:hypothetical protein
MAERSNTHYRIMDHGMRHSIFHFAPDEAAPVTANAAHLGRAERQDEATRVSPAAVAIVYKRRISGIKCLPQLTKSTKRSYKSTSEERKMKNILLVLATGMALSATAGFAATDADVGVLTCKLKGVKNDIVYSKEEFACEFKRTDGKVEEYTGQIKSIGINLSVTKDLTLVWAVLNPTGGVQSKDSLKGDYVGGGASVALGAGAGANILVGGGKGSFTLQPLSASGIVGTGVNVGIKQFELR